jgi:hypothetical protein
MDVHMFTILMLSTGLTLLSVYVVMTSSSYVHDSQFVDVVRRSSHPACSRCAMRHNDWRSCNACYRSAGGGMVPYYNGRAGKRSYDQFASESNDVIVQPSTENEDFARLFRMTSYDEHCCAITRRRSCCQHIAELIEDDATAAAAAAAFDESDAVAAAMCACCHLVTYDAICCQTSCRQN